MLALILGRLIPETAAASDERLSGIRMRKLCKT